MSEREQSFWKYLRKILPLQECHLTRIESECSPGFPDVHYTWRGISGTIELKSTSRPNAKFPFSGKDGLRKGQIDWIQEEIDSGGRVVLALRIDRYIYFLSGDMASKLGNMEQADIEVSSLYFWGAQRGEKVDITQIEIALRG